MSACTLASLTCDVKECGRWRLADDETWSIDRLAEECGFIETTEHGWLCSAHAEEYEHHLPFTIMDELF